jgi:hypothetical protein
VTRCLDERPLDHNAARLLRKVHRGEDIRKIMGRVDRELTLPALVNSALVTVEQTGVHLSAAVRESLMISDRPPSDPGKNGLEERSHLRVDAT